MVGPFRFNDDDVVVFQQVRRSFNGGGRYGSNSRWRGSSESARVGADTGNRNTIARTRKYVFLVQQQNCGPFSDDSSHQSLVIWRSAQRRFTFEGETGMGNNLTDFCDNKRLRQRGAVRRFVTFCNCKWKCSMRKILAKLSWAFYVARPPERHCELKWFVKANV